MCRHVQWCNTVTSTISSCTAAHTSRYRTSTSKYFRNTILILWYWYWCRCWHSSLVRSDISTDFIVCRSSGLLQGHTFIFPAAAALHQQISITPSQPRNLQHWRYLFQIVCGVNVRNVSHMSAIWCYQCRILSLQITLIYNYNSFNW